MCSAYQKYYRWLKISKNSFANVSEVYLETINIVQKYSLFYPLHATKKNQNEGSSQSNGVAHKYRALNEKIEQLSELAYIGMVKVCCPCLIFPALLITAVNYFIKNMGKQSYNLPVSVV